MIFNSVTFLLFLALVIPLYWVLPRRPRLWLVFLASISFYGFWRWEFVPVMLASALIDYLVALSLARVKQTSKRKLLVFVSLALNLGLLFYFKYLGFFIGNLWDGLALLGVSDTPPILDIVLPLGISFYTFQTISYTIDVYRRQIEPERDFVLYASFVVFFPQLVAGPILRASEVIPQLDSRPAYDTRDLGDGLRRVLAGLFLKVVLADNVAPVVDTGFAQGVGALSALDVWTLAFLFGFQIYFDFSAYSHIAIGSARMMGIRLPENFNHPYAAVSPKDFWGRWHISLGSWIRDYLYLPLTGAQFRDRSTGGLENQVDDTRDRRMRALFLTWAIMGFWHGANWTFIVWGLYHAACIQVYRLAEPWRRRWSGHARGLAGWALTFPVMMLSWIPFRAKSISETFRMYAKLFQPSQYTWLGMRENSYLIAALMTFLVVVAYQTRRLRPILKRRRSLWYATETVALTFVVGMIFIFLRPIAQFIYFQF